jgi:hypothetical protein
MMATYPDLGELLASSFSQATFYGLHQLSQHRAPPPCFHPWLMCRRVFRMSNRSLVLVGYCAPLLLSPALHAAGHLCTHCATCWRGGARLRRPRRAERRSRWWRHDVGPSIMFVANGASTATRARWRGGATFSPTAATWASWLSSSPNSGQARRQGRGGTAVESDSACGCSVSGRAASGRDGAGGEAMGAAGPGKRQD